jgi:hypothetical protein
MRVVMGFDIGEASLVVLAETMTEDTPVSMLWLMSWQCKCTHVACVRCWCPKSEDTKYSRVTVDDRQTFILLGLAEALWLLPPQKSS